MPDTPKPNHRKRDPNKPLSILNVWLRAASTPEQEALATRAGTTRNHLYQIANGHRNMSPRKAHALADASAQMHRESGGRLPLLYVTDVCSACVGCPYAAKALGNVVVRSEFPVVGSSAESAEPLA